MSESCVHTEHCCKKHGCKYNDYNCPVAFGDKPQSFPCEWCLEDRNNPLQERIQQLEIACEHVAYYALDNVPQELRDICRAALLKENGKLKHLGNFLELKDAVKARKMAEENENG